MSIYAELSYNNQKVEAAVAVQVGLLRDTLIRKQLHELNVKFENIK